MLNMKNLKQILMDCLNLNWKFFECFINKGKSNERPGLINIRSYYLHLFNNAFKTGANATSLNLHRLPYFQILPVSPARREDYITIINSNVFHFILVQLDNFNYFFYLNSMFSRLIFKINFTEIIKRY